MTSLKNRKTISGKSNLCVALVGFVVNLPRAKFLHDREPILTHIRHFPGAHVTKIWSGGGGGTERASPSLGNGGGGVWSEIVSPSLGTGGGGGGGGVSAVRLREPFTPVIDGGEGSEILEKSRSLCAWQLALEFKNPLIDPTMARVTIADFAKVCN